VPVLGLALEPVRELVPERVWVSELVPEQVRVSELGLGLVPHTQQQLIH